MTLIQYLELEVFESLTQLCFRQIIPNFCFGETFSASFDERLGSWLKLPLYRCVKIIWDTCPTDVTPVCH